MKKVLIIRATNGRQPNFSLRDALRSELGNDILVDTTSLNSLIFDVRAESQQVIDIETGNDIASYNLVVIRNVGSKNIELGITVAHYLKSKKIPFTDSYLETQGEGKLACAMLRARYGLPIPRTIYGPIKSVPDYLDRQTSLEYPLILKANISKQGRQNFLVASHVEIVRKLSENSETPCVIQEYIPNDGDYRALVLDGVIAAVIKRIAGKNTHLTNTSQGGTAALKERSFFDRSIRSDILKAVKLEKLEVAGVDIVINSKTNRHYFLEVNRAPQIHTDFFTQEKIMQYANMIKKRLSSS